MYKKIIAAAIAAAVLITVIILAIPKGTDGDSPQGEGLTVGTNSVAGNFLPFFAASEGDRNVREMVLSKLTCTEADTTVTASDSVPSIAESIDIFYADSEMNESETYTDGGFTAVRFILKDGLLFSDGTPLTSDDVLFSLFALLDPLSEGDKSAFATLAGYDDYANGVKGISELMEKARAILTHDVGTNPSEGDGYTLEEAEAMRAALTKSGAEYAERIKQLVLEKYCTEEMTSSYIFDGVTPEDVLSNDALANAYAVRMWNYGTFVYNYVQDEEGAWVGTTDAAGNITSRTTYESAMEDETYVSYTLDNDNGLYRYDYETGSYVALEENSDIYPRFTRRLSDKYVRLNRTSLSGFRDVEGNFYTLTDSSSPSMEDFFVLMKNSYTTDNGFDYRTMERVESADSFSFSDDAVRAFALGRATGEAVLEISGVKAEKVESNGGTKDAVTLYFEGNDYAAASDADFYVVSKTACLDGYDTDGDNVSAAGTPINSEAFFAHLKELASRPVSAGPYKVVSFEDGAATLDANYYFKLFGEGIANPLEPRITVKDVSGGDPTEMLASGDVMIYLAPVTKDVISSAPENVSALFYPNNSYKYILINPAYYKNTETRLAIASTIDRSAAAEDGTHTISSCVPTYFDSYAGDEESTFDPTGSAAAAHFEAAGYKTDDDGVLIDPATKEQAFFRFYMLPEEKGGKCEKMVLDAVDILRSVGAQGEIIYDKELKTRVYSDENVPIYVLGWEVGDDLSLFERYAYTSDSDAVKGCGIEKLYTVGQLDAIGKVTYPSPDGENISTTQSDAVEALDGVIKAGLSTIDRTVRNSAFIRAQKIVASLNFELPLCEYDSVILVRNDLVDTDTFLADATYSKPPYSEIWKVRTIQTPGESEE